MILFQLIIYSLLNYVKNLISKYLYNDEDEDISEPKDFLCYRKDIKAIDKNIPNNSYWIFPLILIGYVGLYYYNPHLNLDEYLKPVINQIEDKLPVNFPTTVVTGTFIYKFITASITYITGYDLNIFKGDDSLNDDDKSNIKEIISNLKGKLKDSSTDLLNTDEREDLEIFFKEIDEKYDLKDLDTHKHLLLNYLI